MTDPLSDALKDCEKFLLELSSIRDILTTLNETVDITKDETWSATIKLLGDPNSPLDVLTKTLRELSVALEGSDSATDLRKVAKSLQWRYKQNEVEKILRIIERQKATLSLALENDHIALSRDILSNTSATQTGVTDLAREVRAARLDAKALAETLKYDAILSKIPLVGGAAFNAYCRDYERYYPPDTRTEILDQIFAWPDGPIIFWLDGMAGTGRSIISCTVARHIENQGLLGASIFFSRGQGDLGHAEKFFASLAS